MNPGEYRRLAAVEQEHWFYRGKREIVRHWIERLVRLQAQDLLIDAGTGTGTWATEMCSRCQVIGLDDHEESLALAAPRIEAAGGRVLKSDLRAVPLPSGCASVVTALDVLEHLDDDRGAFGEMLRLTRPGGLMVVTVPALACLWSDWDEALHHRRRYDKPGLEQVLRQPGSRLLRCVYFNTAMLPLIALVRWMRRIRPSSPGRRLEDRIPSRPLNALLYHLLVRPACWEHFSPPAGVSLLAIVERENSQV